MPRDRSKGSRRPSNGRPLRSVLEAGLLDITERPQTLEDVCVHLFSGRGGGPGGPLGKGVDVIDLQPLRPRQREGLPQDLARELARDRLPHQREDGRENVQERRPGESPPRGDSSAIESHDPLQAVMTGSGWLAWKEDRLETVVREDQQRRVLVEKGEKIPDDTVHVSVVG